MSAPHGKGLYGGGAGIYVGTGARNAAEYADMIGCSWVAVRGLARDTLETVQTAFDRGLKVHLWLGPGMWLPPNWRSTLGELAQQAAHFGVEGIIADVECARTGVECPYDQWIGNSVEAEKLAHALAATADAMDVGFTTFPSWPYWREYAQIAGSRGVWANPQLYGVREPRTTPAERAFHFKRWKATWPGRVVPAIGAWGRNARQQAAHQREFQGERSAIFWTYDPPAKGSPEFEVLRSAHFGWGWGPKLFAAGAFVGAAFAARRYWPEIEGLFN